MPRVISQMEQMDKLGIQIEEAIRYHRAEAEKALGPGVSDNEILGWFIGEHAPQFAEDWERSQDPTNRWYTGEKVGHDPSPAECWRHFIGNIPPDELRHHQPKQLN